MSKLTASHNIGSLEGVSVASGRFGSPSSSGALSLHKRDKRHKRVKVIGGFIAAKMVASITTLTTYFYR